MAGLEPLKALIYHEKQAQGSMLCAQHALNSLLQGNYFTAPDLSAIARSLDALEQSYDDDNGGTSTNMDDTGFFSVQVLENALQVWGLTLHRWRSEGMRPYHDRPHTQLGFILNLHQHWFTLRRFGAASPNPDLGQGQGHWFNLNSFLEGPEWVGRVYLFMVLEQAEQEGYSVFVVMQSDITAPLALPRIEADELAAQLPEPSSSGLQTSRGSTSRHLAATNIEDFGEDDAELQAALQDMDLQAALQASLMAGGGENSASLTSFLSHSESGLESPLPLPVPPPLIPGTSRIWTQSASGSRTPTQPRSAVVNEALESDGDSGAASPTREDPVAESVARNRSIMERMRRQQEMAFRDNYQEIDMEQVARRRREEEQEEEVLRRVIAESQALQQQRQQGGDDMDTEDDTSLEPLHVPLQTRYHPERVYDDEDAELQAALRASLEDTPEGYQMPDSQSPGIVTPPLAHPELVADLEQAPVIPDDASSKGDTTDSEIASETSSIASPDEVQISMEEMRRRRLAKFGAS